MTRACLGGGDHNIQGALMPRLRGGVRDTAKYSAEWNFSRLPTAVRKPGPMPVLAVPQGPGVAVSRLGGMGLGADGRPYESRRKGTLGGHRRTRVYGRLDCPAALRAIARGGYVANRVFFLNEQHARAAGFRPCAVCLPGKYRLWKKRKNRSAFLAPAA